MTQGISAERAARRDLPRANADVSSAHASPTAPTAQRAFTDLTREHGFEPLRVEGVLPDELRGTLYRNGPALFSSGGRRYHHWFDGDGALTAVRFAGGKAEGAVRLVLSQGLQDERRAGRALRGAYGTASPRNVITRLLTSKKKGAAKFNDSKNAANTSVLVARGQLLALWEGGLPTEIAMGDLSTIGETNLGVVHEAFSAHPRRVPARNATYNFGVRYGNESVVDLYEQRGDDPWRSLGAVTLPGAAMIHDFVATERHLVFFVAPLRLRVFRALLGLGAYSENLTWRPELATEIIVVPIDDVGSPIRIDVPASFQWHYANAYERGSSIVVDMVTYPDFASNRFFGSLPSLAPQGEANGHLARATIDLAARTARFEERAQGPFEFPVIDPRRSGAAHRFAYLAGYADAATSKRDLHDRIVRVDMETGATTRVSLGVGRYPGEPLFVPREGGTAEDDGFIVSLVYDALTHQSHVAVLDAAKLEEGPVARAYFNHHIPFSFHGTWV